LKLEELLRINRQYIPIEPTDRQSLFLMLDCLDAFYGGAAGGGKSIALLTGALLYVHISAYNAILIRDTMKNLMMPDSIMDVSFQWLSGTDAHWNGKKNRWDFPSGATLNFGYLDKPRDEYNFQSSQFQYVGIDEAVNIRKKQAKYMFSRLRRLKEYKDIPIRFRCASNPPTEEQVARGQWVKDEYVDVNTRKKGNIFIPAKMDDNPYLDVNEYRVTLSELDVITRKQLEDGDWEIRSKGKMFNRAWFEIVDSAPIEAQRIRYWDMAATKKTKDGSNEPCYTSGSRLCIDKDKIVYVENVNRFREEPMQTERLVRQTADIDGKGLTIWMEREPGSGGKITIDHYRRNILFGYTFREDRVANEGSKVKRAMPFSAYAEAGNVKLVRGHWNEAFLDELELFPDGKFKDQVDSTSGAFNKLNTNNSPRIRVIKDRSIRNDQCDNCGLVKDDYLKLHRKVVDKKVMMLCDHCIDLF
jgi:predicted phage terminase large subunit-like protein